MLVATTSAPAFSVFADELRSLETKILEFKNPEIQIPVDVGYIDATEPESPSFNLIPEETEREIYYTTGEISTAEIRVDIIWDELKFIYDFGTVTDYDWNFNKLRYTPNYKYENGNGPGWNKDYINFTFTNRSNRDVVSGLHFTKNTATDLYDNVTLTPDNHRVSLSSAVGRSENDLACESIKLYIKDDPDKKIKQYSDQDIPALGSVRFSIEAIPLQNGEGSNKK